MDKTQLEVQSTRTSNNTLYFYRFFIKIQFSPSKTLKVMTSTQVYYDAFLSYSSKDVKYAIKLQRYIEQYRPPKDLNIEGGNLKIFRDKDDQALTNDYEITFNSWIDSIPNFILLGSYNAMNSQPVGKEIAHFMQKGSSNICLSWLDNSTPNFPYEVTSQYPNAVYANFGFLRITNRYKWFTNDKKLFKIESLRIIAQLLSQRTETQITLDTLIKREEIRARRRMVRVGIILLCLLFGLVGYIISTPKRAWYYTDIKGRNITNYQIKAIDGNIKLWVTYEVIKSWEDSSGESGHDSDVILYQIDKNGVVEGSISFSTFDVEQNFDEENAKIWGTFLKYKKEKMSDIIKQAISPQSLSADLYTAPSYDTLTPNYIISPFFDGNMYMCSQKDTYPFAPKMGGLYHSKDYGKTWNIVKMDIWDSFRDLVADFESNGTIAVIACEIKGTNLFFPRDDSTLLPSLWSTDDFGKSWDVVMSDKQLIDMDSIDLIWMTDQRIFAIISKNGKDSKLVVYKARSLFDRFAQRFDNL